MADQPAFLVPRWVMDGVQGNQLAWDIVFIIRTWPYERVVTSREVTEGQKQLYAINQIESHRLVAGYHRVLRSVEPVLIIMAIEGARRMGADEYAATLEAATEVVFPDGMPRNAQEEEAGWDAFDRSLPAGAGPRSAFVEIDQRGREANLHSYLTRFVHAHPGEFFFEAADNPGDVRLRLWFIEQLMQDTNDDAELARMRLLLDAATAEAERLGDPDCLEECEQIQAKLATLSPTPRPGPPILAKKVHRPARRQ